MNNGKLSTLATGVWLMAAVSIPPLLLAGCATEEQQPEEVRASYDSVSISGTDRESLLDLSNTLDGAIQVGARVDLIVDPSVGMEAVAQIVLPSDSALPKPEDITTVVDGIESSEIAEAFAWRVEAVSPAGALISVADAARAAGVSPVNISPFGDIRIESAVSENKQ